MNLTENFASVEFKCKDGTPVPIHYMEYVQDLARQLQKVRDYLDKPIRINSGYRTPAYNRSVGGVDGSYHTLAMAADISVQDTSPEEVYCAIERLIADRRMQDGGLGYYGRYGHIHYDIGTPRRWTKPAGLAVPICPPKEEEVTQEELDKLNARLKGIEAFQDGIANLFGKFSDANEAFHAGSVEYVAVLSDMAERGKDFDVGIARYFGELAEKQVESFDQMMSALYAHINIHNQSSGPLDRETATFLDKIVSPQADVSRIGKRVAAIATLKSGTERTDAK